MLSQQFLNAQVPDSQASPANGSQIVQQYPIDSSQPRKAPNEIFPLQAQSISISELTKKCRSKKQLYDTLYEYGDMFLPPVSSVKVTFFETIFNRKVW